MSSRQLALIGAGYWGKNLARNFHQLGALHTLCDTSRATLDSYGLEYAGVAKTTAVESLWTSPAITRVAIAAPAVHHHRLAKAALLAGKDVYVEKPLCLTIPEAEEIIALARERGRILMVGHLLQYHPCVQRLLELVAAGECGPLYYVTSNRLNLGKIRREENVLWSFAPHDFSVILSLAGHRLPTRVQCSGGSFLTSGLADTAVTAMTFDSGLKAQVSVSWLNPFKEQKITVVGASGLAVFDDTKPWAEKLGVQFGYLGRDAAGHHSPAKLALKFISPVEAEPLQAECQHFLDCCATRQSPRTDGAEGLRVLRVLQAAEASLAQDGQLERLGLT